MMTQRKINIPSELFKKYAPQYAAKKMSSDELFFKWGFDIMPDGTVFHPKHPNISLPTVIMDKMVRYNPIINGEKFIFTIHRLQAYKKWKSKIFKEGIIVIHKDSDLMNNHIDNLKLGTRSDRMMMIPQEQRQKAAEHAASSQMLYDHDKVIAFYLKCKSYKKTMEEFGIASKSTLNNILKKIK